MVTIKDHELGKKERIISELIEEKIKYETMFNQKEPMENHDSEGLKSEIQALKLEKEALLKFTAGGTVTPVRVETDK